MRIRTLAAALCCALSPALMGCRQQTMTEEAAGPLTVTVSRPVQREVTEYGYFIGRTEAVNSVDINARVTGYLEKTLFTEVSDAICVKMPTVVSGTYAVSD